MELLQEILRKGYVNFRPKNWGWFKNKPEETNPKVGEAEEETVRAEDPPAVVESLSSASTSLSSSDLLTLSSSGEATETNVASIESALAVIEKLRTENAQNAEAMATLDSLKTKLSSLKESLEKDKTSTEETKAAVETAKTELVDLAKKLGLTGTEETPDASNVLTAITTALDSEGSSTSLLLALLKQQTLEEEYNQAATSQVLASAIAESQLAQGRYLLQSVRGQAQGAFANVFYNSKNLSVLDVTYPTLVLGGDYQIVPSTKAGAALTVSTAELELARANTYLQDIAYGFNVFVDYSENDIFATGLVGYTKHDVFGTLLGSKYDHQYNSFDFAARVGYDFDFAESGKASVAGVYQFNSLGFTKLKTHVFGVEADYKYKLDNTFELTAGLGVYFQSHNKAKLAVPSYVQVVNSTLVDFGKNAYKKSGAAVAVNLGLTSYIAKNSVLSTEFGYQRDPRGSSNYNVNVGYRFKFN